jgi:hypothetical protein
MNKWKQKTITLALSYTETVGAWYVTAVTGRDP